MRATPMSGINLPNYLSSGDLEKCSSTGVYPRQLYWPIHGPTEEEKKITSRYHAWPRKLTKLNGLAGSIIFYSIKQTYQVLQLQQQSWLPLHLVACTIVVLLTINRAHYHAHSRIPTASNESIMHVP